MSGNVVKLAENVVECRNCGLRGMCTPASVNKATQSLLDNVIRKRRPVARGEVLMRYGMAQNSIYCVRSGSIKSFAATDDGHEMVTGFHLPGELIGLAGINDRSSNCTAVALETSSVCEIPLDRMDELRRRVPELQDELLRMMSLNILHYQNLMVLLGRKSAEERLAAFLFSLSNRFKQRGFSASEFYLSMSRTDIANFLGLAVETVSRVFTRFDEDGLLTVQRKYIHIHDMTKLRMLAGNPTPRQQLMAQS